MIPARPMLSFFAPLSDYFDLSWHGTHPFRKCATPRKPGLKIAQDSRAREEGFGNFTAQQIMVLRNKHGQESRRQLRIKVLEVAKDGDKSLFVFDEPRDVQGTALLIHSYGESADDQWLYLPALKRVKRISSSNRFRLPSWGANLPMKT